jgi:hypothetical protein
LCETTALIPGHVSYASGIFDCDDDTLPSSFIIRAFNAKEGWVWLELDSPVDKTL